MTRLVACDIDGTLLRGGAETVDEETLSAIRRLQARGIRFVPNTGRQYGSICELFGSLAEGMYLISENGSALYAPGKEMTLLECTLLPPRLCRELAADILAQEQCELLISTAGRDYLVPKSPGLRELLRPLIGPGVGVLDRLEDTPAPIIKMAAYCRRSSYELERVLAPRWRGHMNVAVAGERWLDFTLTDKGEGLKRLCAILGVDPADTIAVGDSFNDCSMLDAAGRGYIMSTANPVLLRRYPLHCSGVAELLDKL